jgi:hypothetical protein
MQQQQHRYDFNTKAASVYYAHEHLVEIHSFAHKVTEGWNPSVYNEFESIVHIGAKWSVCGPFEVANVTPAESTMYLSKLNVLIPAVRI